MLRQAALLAVLVAVAGVTAVVVSQPAEAAVTSSTITTPANRTRYLITDASPPGMVTVSGTSNGTTGDQVDIRCYFNAYDWDNATSNVAVAADGSFTTSMSTDVPYGTCVLRAVPSGLAAGSNLTPYTGPRVITEWKTSDKIASGPNAGKVYDYYVLYQSAHAMNDYVSATEGGLWDTRLQYSDGTSSNYLWYENAALPSNEGGSRSFLQVDGRNAYGPRTAESRFPDNPGFPQLTFSASRNSSGTTTIHETDPIVVCPTETPFPPTTASCPRFNSAGVRLERTIVTTDGGRQVRINDVWRSTDHHAHTISAHYYQTVEGYDRATNTSTQVSLKLPWVSGAYQTFTSDVLFPAPAKVPATAFVRDENTAPDGSTALPRGAISFDVAPQVHRGSSDDFTLRDDGINVPAGGTHLVREAFVIGTTESEVAAKAAANRQAINPYRPDALIRKQGTSSYVGDNTYNTNGFHQTALTKLHRGSTTTFFIKIENDGTTRDSFAVKGPGSKATMSAKYLAGATGATNITAGIVNGSYTLQNLAPGASKIIRLVVKVKSSAHIGATDSWLVSTRSTHDSTRRDANEASVQVISG